MSLDIVVVLIIGLSGLFAWYRGLMRELLGLASWVIVFFGAWYGCELVQPLFARFISHPDVARWASIAALALLILIVCTIINAIIAHKLRKTFLKTPDQMLGFVFGILRGLLCVVLIYFAVTRALPPKEWERYVDESHLSPVLQACDVVMEKALPESASTYFSDMREESPAPKQKGEDKKQEQAEEDSSVESFYDAAQRKALDKLIEQQLQAE